MDLANEGTGGATRLYYEIIRFFRTNGEVNLGFDLQIKHFINALIGCDLHVES